MINTNLNYWNKTRFLKSKSVTAVILGMNFGSGGIESDSARVLASLSELTAEDTGVSGVSGRWTRFSYLLWPVPVPYPPFLAANPGICSELQTEGGLANRNADSGDAADRTELAPLPRTDWVLFGRPGISEPEITLMPGRW